MQKILFFANDPPSQILRQHANTTPLGTLSATNSCHYCCCASFQLQFTKKAWWELRDWLRIIEHREMFFRAMVHECLFYRNGCTHMFKNKRLTNTFLEGSFLRPLDHSFLGPKSMTLPGNELKSLPLANANQTVSSDSQNGTTGDETKIFQRLSSLGVLCTAISSVVACQIKNSSYIILEILASCARAKCSVNLTFCY